MWWMASCLVALRRREEHWDSMRRSGRERKDRMVLLPSARWRSIESSRWLLRDDSLWRSGAGGGGGDGDEKSSPLSSSLLLLLLLLVLSDDLLLFCDGD